MRLTPIEIRRHRFNHRLRGFDRDEVRTFLDMVISDFEDVVRENAQLRRESERLAREVENHRGKEQSIQRTLTTTQGLVDELRRTASKEAELIVAEAEVRAQKTLQQAEAYRASIAEEISQMNHIRSRLETDLRNILQGYLSLIDAYPASRSQLLDSNGEGSAEAKPNGR